MSRSSIFNFEALREFKPALPRGLLTAAALVLLLEISVRVVPEKYLVTFYSRLGFGVYMENVVLPEFKDPKIAIFGTSRAADAFMPSMLDEALNLPQNSTINMGLFGSRTSDWEALYSRNRARLKSCGLVVLVVDEWSFSSGVGSDEHFGLTAPLSERWNFAQATESPVPRGESDDAKLKRESAKLENLRSKRNRLLADWAFNLRLKLGFVPMALVKATGLGNRRNPPFDANHMSRSNTLESGGAIVRVENYDDRIRGFYKFFDTQPIYVRQVEEFARRVKEDGGQFVIVHLPNRRTYQDEVEKLYPLEYAQHVRNTKALAERLGVPFYYFRYPEEMGLKDADYEDYCHLAWNGTVVATRWLIERVEGDKLLR